MKLVISVSGGGALGIGPLQFMKRLEADLGKSLSKVCEAFAGTSTGSIIASGLCSGMKANELYDIYKDSLPSIFKKKGRGVAALKSKYVQYDNSGLKKLLLQYFPGKMDAFPKPIYIPTTFMNGKSVEKVWDRTDAWMDRWFAILSSCSAPTYFDLLTLDGNTYCDGGMWANDPIMVLESGLKTIVKNRSRGYKKFEEGFKIISFNTGMDSPNAAPKSQNALGWLTYIMDAWVARTGNSGLYEARANIGEENVFSCSPEIEAKYAMDDLTKLDEVSEIWDRYYDSVKDKVLEFVRTTL